MVQTRVRQIAWISLVYDTIPSVYEIKLNDETVCKNNDKIAAFVNFRSVVRRSDLTSNNIVCLFEDGETIECHNVGSVDIDIGEKITPNDVLLRFMHSNNLTVSDIKKAAKSAGLVVSNSKIGGWISKPENRKYQNMHMDELILMLEHIEIKRGYTPKNYQALVKSTGLSNADFMRKFDVPESTFYANIAEIDNARHSSMSYKTWRKLVGEVEKFNSI